MYALLRRFLPPWLAAAVLVLWYTALILLVWHCSTAPAGEFRYGNL
jgi:hypothetical protein